MRSMEYSPTQDTAGIPEGDGAMEKKQLYELVLSCVSSGQNPFSYAFDHKINVSSDLFKSAIQEWGKTVADRKQILLLYQLVNGIDICCNTRNCGSTLCPATVLKNAIFYTEGESLEDDMQLLKITANAQNAVKKPELLKSMALLILDRPNIEMQSLEEISVLVATLPRDNIVWEKIEAKRNELKSKKTS